MFSVKTYKAFIRNQLFDVINLSMNMCGNTKLVKIRSKYNKLQDSTLRWYGHVRRSPDYFGNTVIKLDNPGSRERGRPKLTDSIAKD